VVRPEGYLFGAAVNAAARITAQAAGGEILVAAAVRHIAGSMPGVEFRDRGPVALKGLPERRGCTRSPGAPSGAGRRPLARDRVARVLHVGGAPPQSTVAGARRGGRLRIIPEASPFSTQSGDFTSRDPALNASFTPQANQFEYAVCAKLLNYPDRSGRAGGVLIPEVAHAMPHVSADERTYTFELRRGFRFSPPSGEPVTAAAFARAR
jgi:hypothetical protein